ncbi:G2/mitotic-specific cyclin S13-7-like [Andrographis paniculata]|uniref:G2/mitotic-specific cyclin S13-7-like n=1 Tax=Andrographis paniculata TaxID=175694 RepID=UPI0021E88846|nr:G2/mitotic-specific cyclin S13-7-like [Andrographis paniculata]
MASKAAVPENPQGGVKQKNVQAEGRTRKVLRDIGNLVPPQGGGIEGKLQNPVSRPGPRLFGVQLLDNAQAAAEKNNCKKLLAEKVNAGVPMKSDAVKPTIDEVIVISSDESGSSKRDKNVRLKKPGKSLTSTLTARSKAACGIANKPDDLTLDIDAADVNNELAAVEYVEDMHKYYKLAEKDGYVNDDYMHGQLEINAKMRAILVGWLIEVHRKFELMPESLYLTVNIVDRVLSIKTVPRRELQLVGIGAMLIACKYEEIWAPMVSDFIEISDNAYTSEQVLRMEKMILGKLEWYLTVPTPYVFLIRYIKASVPADKEMENMAFFYAELGLVDYSTVIKYSPSKLSAAAVYAARCTLNRTPLWTETLKHYTGYAEDELMECVKMLGSFHSEASEKDEKFKAVSRKYSKPERGAVSLLPPSIINLALLKI